jgi:methyl-accepting chemotaxis protein
MQENMAKIKAKIQELSVLVKEQTSEETKGIKEEILQNVNEMKTVIEEKLAYGLSHKDEIIDKTADSLIEAINKAKNALQSKQQ